MTSRPVTPCLLGGALGDSLGLPAEGLSAARIARMWPGPLRHRFFFGHGMVSDDTEHAVMTALCLAKHSGNADAFARDLARRLRWWLAGVPAGVGLATARATIKLWLGARPTSSGVISAGNGPLMRAPVIGVWFHNDPQQRKAHVDASTRITHKDPRAVEAARIIAEAAAWSAEGTNDLDVLWDRISTEVEGDEMRSRLQLLKEGLTKGIDVREFADSFGRKRGYVSGFAPDTATVALYAWLRHRGDFRQIITSCITAGGDTDTVAFVAGSLAGIETHHEDFPKEWLAGLRDYPINAATLTRDIVSHPFLYPNWPLSWVRNVTFFLIVLAHAFRRACPPY